MKPPYLLFRPPYLLLEPPPSRTEARMSRKLSKAERAVAVAWADGICSGLAREHTELFGHATVLVSGTGWACQTCDPDLWSEMSQAPTHRWEISSADGSVVEK